MAADTAFAVGVLTLFSSRVPSLLKVFLTALTVMDGQSAIIVIVIVIVIVLFYPTERSAGFLLALMSLLMLASDVHATIADVQLWRSRLPT